ncbi:PLP-dependent aminotransferase family protein [Roseibium aggregatum]|uniref:aminotransferase-like domain-containing protein n=1 Tax=Roseibium aggregatum TaxID=187304 RepID=UPI001A9025D1|nr:PLP-dependent aminotransferase family protein [Roseibium aggregatum]MBN8180383.1 PLP-dependent aminotransferase family protein [Roseibium aggregatum]UES45489.1 aminotransferase class I/II-fold pyridoxal phosphate-dependent enzyme [Roseibium aggregatum]
MLATYFDTPFDPGRRLQHQIQERLIEAILDGVWPLHEPLPATRVFSSEIKVSRNTVAIVYERLVEDGYLKSVSRRGYFINERHIREQLNIRVDDHAKDILPTAEHPFNPQVFLTYSYAAQENISKPADWQSYPYPFIYGQLAPDKTSVARWRDCVRLAGTAQHAPTWIGDLVDQDDPMLVNQIIRRMLPQRGFRAEPDEILVTVGAQNALFLVAQLLCRPGVRTDMEEPGYVDTRNIFQSFGAELKYHPVDSNGMRVGDELKGARLVYVTPGHQSPTNVTMSMERRLRLLAHAETHDFIVLEDDYEHELNFIGAQKPSLRSFDRTGRVIHVASLSKALFPGLRLGFIAADGRIIRELRALRRLMYRHPSALDQRAMAIFLSEGHYDSHIRRQRKVLSQKWKKIFRLIETHLPTCQATVTTGGSGVWIRLPESIRAAELQSRAARQGLLIEAGDDRYFSPNSPRNRIRLGFGAIAEEKMEPGIKLLGQLLADSR